MAGATDRSRRPRFGLSARLLVMTIIFVMLAEVLIFVPSISRYRQSHLREHIAKAHIAVLALEATPDQMVSPRLERDLLYHANAHGIVLREQDRNKLMLAGTMPPAVDLTVRPFDESVLSMIYETFVTLFQSENRILRVIGPSPRVPEATIELIIDESPMRLEMYAYGWRILALSIIISLITAGLVYLTLQWLMVRPMCRLIDCMMDFGDSPEDPKTMMSPSGRRDEIGLAERQLASMQKVIRDSLQQKTRLAALGAAVAKINHDLRNTLSTAVIASDALSANPDPEVRRVASRLYGTIDRAVTICTQSLRFARGEKPPVDVRPFALQDLIAEAVAEVEGQCDPPGGKPIITTEISPQIAEIEADRDQMTRVLTNLVLNAAQSGAGRIAIRAFGNGGGLDIEVADDGPGIAPEVVDKLFIPFAGSSRDTGTGLGLAISREIVRAHGGDLVLVKTGDKGTVFRIRMPGRRVRAAA